MELGNQRYWDGNKNKTIRYYFYLQKGLGLFNEFKYLFMLIFGVYYTLKLTNFIWLILMFVVSLPIIIAIGYVYVHHIGKVVEWLGIEFSTYWSRYQFHLIEKQIKIMEDINEKLGGR